MCRIVKRQIIGQDPSVCFHTVVERGSGIRCQDMGSHGLNLILYDPVQSCFEGIGGITVETEDETRIDHNASGMDRFDRLFIFMCVILDFMYTAYGSRIDAFKADKEALAPGTLHQIQQFFIKGGIDRYRCTPFQVHRTYDL